jgi:hypothetical protein
MNIFLLSKVSRIFANKVRECPFLISFQNHPVALLKMMLTRMQMKKYSLWHLSIVQPKYVLDNLKVLHIKYVFLLVNEKRTIPEYWRHQLYSNLNPGFSSLLRIEWKSMSKIEYNCCPICFLLWISTNVKNEKMKKWSERKKLNEVKKN